jgi:hypothetical protein
MTNEMPVGEERCKTTTRARVFLPAGEEAVPNVIIKDVITERAEYTSPG